MNRITILFIIVSFCFIIFQSCQNKVNNFSGTNLYESTKIDLKSQKINSPLKFLKVTGSFHKNFWGQLVINGNIYSSATIAKYKDITLRISFISQTNSLISESNSTIYDYFYPNSSKEFKLKLDAPKDTKNVNLNIENANSM
jgi:hypothetical protein